MGLDAVSHGWSQIGLPPTEQPPKGEKVDEQTLMQNRMREKDEKKRKWRKRREGHHLKSQRSPFSERHGLNHPTQ